MGFPAEFEKVVAVHELSKLRSVVFARKERFEAVYALVGVRDGVDRLVRGGVGVIEQVEDEINEKVVDLRFFVSPVADEEAVCIHDQRVVFPCGEAESGPAALSREMSEGWVFHREEGDVENVVGQGARDEQGGIDPESSVFGKQGQAHEIRQVRRGEAPFSVQAEYMFGQLGVVV